MIISAAAVITSIVVSHDNLLKGKDKVLILCHMPGFNYQIQPDDPNQQ